MKAIKNNLVLIDAVNDIKDAIESVKDSNPTLAFKLTGTKSKIEAAAHVQTSEFIKDCVNIALSISVTETEKEFFYKSVEGLSVQEICDISGLSFGSVYRCIRNKSFTPRIQDLLRKRLE